MTDSARLEHTGEGRYLLCGELSFATVPALLREGEGAFREAAKEIVLDLENVTRADSAGLALLVEWARSARRRKVPLSIRNITPQLKAMARVAGLERVLPL